MSYFFIISENWWNLFLVTVVLSHGILSAPVQNGPIASWLRSIRGNHIEQEEEYCNIMGYNEDIAQGFKGCKPKIIKKYVCYGQCPTMFLPSHRSGSAHCTMCAPTSRRTIKISLDCENYKEIVVVPLVSSCGCQSCPNKKVFPFPSQSATKKRSHKKSREKIRLNKLRMLRKQKQKRKKRRNRKNRLKKNLLKFRKKLHQKKIKKRNKIRRKKHRKRRKKNKEKQNVTNYRPFLTYNDLMNAIFLWQNK